MGNAHVSTIANLRMISYMTIPHFAFYFEGVFAVNENGGVVQGAFNKPVTAEKIVMNHYSVKSREEYAKKVSRGAADHGTYQMKNFDINDRNEEFDDSILKPMKDCSPRWQKICHRHFCRTLRRNFIRESLKRS